MDIASLGLKPLPRKPGCTGPMSKEELKWMMRKAERKPRLRIRLQEIYLEFTRFAKPPNKRFHTPDEWKQFRKLMRQGKRIASCLNDAQYKEIFGVMYATATVYLAGGGHLNGIPPHRLK